MYIITFTDKNGDDWDRRTDDLDLQTRIIQKNWWKIIDISKVNLLDRIELPKYDSSPIDYDELCLAGLCPNND